MMNRRNFLKIAATTTGSIVVNPFKGFESLAGILPVNGSDDVGINRLSLGLLKVFIGNSSLHISDTSPCIKKSLGLAFVTMDFKSDLFKDVIHEDVSDGYAVKESVILECSFKNPPKIVGSLGRVEASFFYPNGSKMIIILPKAKLKKVDDVFCFTSLPTNHRSWRDMPLGRIVWQT